MASRKIRDLVVKVGEYTDRNTGETKGRFENIGALMKGEEDDSLFIMLKRTFNPAGVPNNDERESILISCYVPKEQREQQEQRKDTSGGDYGAASGKSSQQPAQSPQFSRDMDDDIPFMMEWRG